MKNDKENSEKHLGFIAQEVKDVIKQAYVETKEMIGLNYNPIVATLVKAVQELKQEIETLKNK
jgi:alcohol dehydrogenase YqhD (iron-dependent ADH family)